MLTGSEPALIIYVKPLNEIIVTGHYAADCRVAAMQHGPPWSNACEGILLYQLYDLHHAAWLPMRLAAEATQTAFQNPFVPASYTRMGRSVAAGAELLERLTRRFPKPPFGLRTTTIGGETVKVTEQAVVNKPFCTLKRFVRATDRRDPQVLVVAPMSGHHATLLRGT